MDIYLHVFYEFTFMENLCQEFKYVSSCLLVRELATKAMMFELGPNSDQSDVSPVFTVADILRFWLVISGCDFHMKDSTLK
jgi:hypothetical protein